MVARAWGAERDTRPQAGRRGEAAGAHEELTFRNAAVSLCMTVNRRARTMRIVDYRAGATEEKRQFVLSVARREGVEKIYTLVERDEIASWLKLGLQREATVPSFYKRSDAFLLGALVSPEPAAPPRAKALGPLPDASDEAAPVAASPAHALMERTIAAAKRALKDAVARALPPARIAVLAEADAKRAVAAALKSGRALTGFEPFGRDGVKTHFVATVRGGLEVHAAVESQACFSNAFLELLVSPRTDAERLATSSVVRAFCEQLLRDEVVCCFALAPSDDLPLAEVFLQNGFRRTGLLLGHLLVGGVRKDAVLWARKLLQMAEE